MIEIEKDLVPLLSAQFPSFYEDEGPIFILFLKEYYKWLGTKTYTVDGENVAGGASYHSRSLLQYRDIDQTVEDYVVYFKEKYLKGVNFDTQANRKLLVKAARDLFKAKGSELSMDLLFGLLYGINISIYTPGDDILRPSDGRWNIPRYLEVRPSPKSASLAGELITGSKSSATAFVEYVITRNIKGTLVDILFLSNVDGIFEVDDIVTSDGIIENAPKVLGSYYSIDITTPGNGFEVGEEVLITSSTGVEGRAYVSSVEEVTGQVQFTMTDAGWGYSTTANTIISNKVVKVNNLTNSNASITEFYKYETVEQNNFSLTVTNIVGNLSSGYLTNSSNALFTILSKTQTGNTATVIVNPVSGNPFANTILYTPNDAFVAVTNTLGLSVGTTVTQQSGGSNTATGVVSSIKAVQFLSINATSISSNGIHVGNYILQTSSLVGGNVIAIPRESNHSYSNVTGIVVEANGIFTNTDVINVYDSASNLTFTANATPLLASNSSLYTLSQTSGTNRWSTSNTILSTTLPTSNATILLASDLGGKYTANTSVKATANVIGSNSTALGLADITGTFYSANTNYIIGQESNTQANVSFASTGTGADFSIGSITDTETVVLATDMLTSNNSEDVKFNNILILGHNAGFNNVSSIYIYSSGTGYDNADIVTFSGGNSGVGSYGVGNATLTTDTSGNIVSITLSANTGNNIITNPTVAVTNSSGGTSTGSGANLYAVSSYGFSKNITGNFVDDTLFSMFSYATKTIGSIVSFTGVNPGENYNIDPFVNVIEPAVAAYGKKDYTLFIENLSKNIGFQVGELIEATISTPTIVISANGYSGNTANNYEVGEYVVSSNSSANTGYGYVLTSTKNSTTNVYTIVLTGTGGTFTNTLFGTTTLSNTTIISSAANTSTSYARARVRTGSNTSQLTCRRESLFADMSPGSTITGKTTGETATIVSVVDVGSSNVAGDNAVIYANIAVQSGAISGITLVDSGYGFVQDQGADISSLDGERLATGKINLAGQGTGAGYYSSAQGLLDDTEYIHDGEYYQEFSYEIRSPKPLSVYADVLKQVLHVAGSKYFGKVVTESVANVQTNVAESSVTIV